MAVITNHIISSIITISDLNRLTIGIQCVIDSVTLTTGDHEVFTITNNDLVDATEAGVVRGRQTSTLTTPRSCRSDQEAVEGIEVSTRRCHQAPRLREMHQRQHEPRRHTRATKNDIGTLADEDQIVATMLRSNGLDASSRPSGTPVVVSKST